MGQDWVEKGPRACKCTIYLCLYDRDRSGGTPKKLSFSLQLSSRIDIGLIVADARPVFAYQASPDPSLQHPIAGLTHASTFDSFLFWPWITVLKNIRYLASISPAQVPITIYIHY